MEDDINHDLEELRNQIIKFINTYGIRKFDIKILKLYKDEKTVFITYEEERKY